MAMQRSHCFFLAIFTGTIFAVISVVFSTRGLREIKSTLMDISFQQFDVAVVSDSDEVNDNEERLLVHPKISLRHPVNSKIERRWLRHNKTALIVSQGAASHVSHEEATTRPKFYLEVGLPKTATTYLQCSLCSQADITEPILLKDNFVYYGACPYNMCRLRTKPQQFPLNGRASFFGGGGISRDKIIEYWQPLPHDRNDSIRFPSSSNDGGLPKLNPAFVKRINQLREQDRNVIAISEHLSFLEDQQIQALATFLQKDWDVEVLVAYRPLYSWLPSKYTQETKPAEYRRLWPGVHERKNAKRNVTGQPSLPFDLDNRYEAYHNFSGAIKRIESIQQHPTETCMRNYAMHFSNVSVIPLHELPDPAAPGADPILNYLFCILWKTPHTCQAVLARQVGSNVASNPRYSFNYDILATAAYEAGLIMNKEISRGEARRRIESRQERDLKLTADDFPLVCLPKQTLARLENISLSVEKHLFRDSWTREKEQTHQEGFAKSVAKNAYCWIDTNRTLMDPEWRSFLSFQTEEPALIKKRRMVHKNSTNQLIPS